ncbi:aminopeptidase [Gemelliphila palaticanis]|uniref:Aminopeptidase n=1 Tax=Gemelliphila palaticanis TaxID=81950 RepID=A0ABX2T346_9BACL|nr:aminopeptidase [Gemella palaticanis]MBF0715944.1 aminopeptidase [Gemella palaticanis]NYS47874.1 aminopeptidase [Gemella palaticanis]
MTSELYEKLEQRIANYAKVVAKIGINAQENQEIVIRSSIEARKFALLVSEECYKLGAKKVRIDWNDQKLTKQTLTYASEETLKDFPQWMVDMNEDAVHRGSGFISIISDDPDGLSSVDSSKLKTAMITRSKALRNYMKAVMNNECPWTIAAASSIEWSKRLFPELPEEEGYLKLWDLILQACRVDGDGLANWEEHIKVLDEKGEFLNSNQFEKLHITSENGTDLYVGLPNNHIWQSAGSIAGKTGQRFVANIPTEEVFTLPHKDLTNGIVYNTKPLNYAGVIIDDFWLKFEDGKVVDCGAKRGEEVLKNLLDTDEGSRRIGEIALVPFDSPISNTNTLFLETLYDENASCHIALGKAYPTCLVNGENMSDSELSAAGANDSLVHVDFMIGEKTTTIFGVTKSGEEIAIFKDGNWA